MDINSSEKMYMESVYQALDQKLKIASDSVREAKSGVDAGAYDDQEAFMEHGRLGKARKKKREIETLVTSLYPRPYFAHVEVRREGKECSEQYFLSDCENLEEIVQIGDTGKLIPFKKDEDRPILSALYRCYQAKRREPVSYNARENKCILIPEFSCNDNIKERQLLETVQLFPRLKLLENSVDELLEKKIRENRNSDELRSIIASLQHMQFEIVDNDINESFVVQGCAGSGKSQCLFHRLFYLRDQLDKRWEHVLLITPSQLFRNYSAELIRRFQLSSVVNCSIGDLYRTLLYAYDERFKNRQYYFEISEEYLPDKYLREVYDSSLIERIDLEIQKAIHKYAADACAAIGMEIPEQITCLQIENIVKQLDEKIHAFDDREVELRKDKEFLEKREQLESLKKQSGSMKKRLKKLNENHKKVLNKVKQIQKLSGEVQEAEQERSEFLEQNECDINNAFKELMELKRKRNQDKDIELSEKYKQQSELFYELLYGKRYKVNELRANELHTDCKKKQSEFQKIAGTDKLEGLIKKREDIQQEISQWETHISEINQEIKACEEWLKNRCKSVGDEANIDIQRRSELGKVRYSLTRIESTVFEKEVWNVITPLKEKYNVSTHQIEILTDGRQKETRILYKSDCLFYLKIYTSLHANVKLPEYQFICVDEGQDLNKADYDMLHKIYPDAVLNIFGDTNQVIHESCGIHRWREETGVEKEYFLNRNYRNDAAIVDFCNKHFKTEMKYIGNVEESHQPHIIKENQMIDVLSRPEVILIVKDKSILEKLCKKIQKPISEFEYIDTNAKQIIGGKIACYSIFAAKGLEFKKVVVYAKTMTTNQKIVACTRAMEKLYYCE